MNNIPTMMLTTGFKVDQNGALTEIVTPSVVTTLDQPKKIVFNGTALNYVPSTAAALEEFAAPNVTSISDTLFKGYAGLTRISFASVASLITSSVSNSGAFYGCTSLTEINLPALTTLRSNNTGCGAFYGCTSLTEINLPNLTVMSDYGSGCGDFFNCTSLRNVTLPKLQYTERRTSGSVASGTFTNCTSLQNVTLGSEGHAVTGLYGGNGGMFSGCTQSGLTITIYTTGGAAISGSPWGATNATIVYEEA